MADFFSTDIKFLKGVGEARAKALKSEFGITTMRDLLYYFPIRHIDRSRIYRISELDTEMPMLQVVGQFVQFNVEGEGLKKRLIGIFTDGTGLMEVCWFSRVEQIKESYHTGCNYLLFGKPTEYRGTFQMSHPEVSRFDQAAPPSGFQGIYSISETARKKGWASRMIAGLVKNAITHPRFAEIRDTMPREVVERYHLMPLGEALKNVHIPSNPADLRKAIERFKFEELFYLELHILRYVRQRNRRVIGRLFPVIGNYFNSFYYNCLPFELTGAQKRVLKEIRADMRTGRQMNRLLQGDVGSGKTMVAFMTMLMAVDNGCQAAIMAPTEILAGQHFETISAWAEKIGLKVELLTGSVRAKKRREIHEGLESGDINILVGTHALIEDSVKFKNLGLTVIDEQHRFGVAQRAMMWAKSEVPPHVLVMTATPIPRTLAMTVYGDLDVSVIDELPPGRKPVATHLRTDQSRNEVYQLVAREIKAGRQVYIVYPLIYENEKLSLKSVEQGLERIKGIFPDIPVCCVHGKMKPAEKDAQMELFVSGKAKILVATTVIEVGVNVPNASVMIIENAERFGLSQLHQLRGRVGRGSDHSYCILMTHAKIGGDTKKRLNIMTETSDGFLIAEADMKLRGPGDMEGTQQSGLAFSLNMASLATDGQILNVARDAAIKVLDANPQLIAVENNDVKATQDNDMILSSDSIATLGTELSVRFARNIDWSQIS